MRIGLDVMGGDHVPQAPVTGALAAASLFANRHDDVELVLVGQQDVIEAELSKHASSARPFTLVHAPEVISMHDHPSRAVVQKQQSSIVEGFRLLKSGALDAFVSAGNTGAVLAASVIMLGTIPGVIRPTIGATYTINGHSAFLCDLGANTDCKPEYLVQFGLLGSLYMKTVVGVKNPRVALMNIGEEPGKGNQLAQQAQILFQQQADFTYIGNAEGRDLNTNKADVFVCDGFTGNILLKFAESFYDIFAPKLPNDPSVNHLNYENIGGLPFIGVKGNVIIGHGISSPLAFQNMLINAVELTASGLVANIESAMGASAS